MASTAETRSFKDPQSCLQASGFDIHVLEHDTAVTYAVDAEKQIRYCNQAWDTFAHENGTDRILRSSIVGRRLGDFIPASLAAFYDHLFGQAEHTGAVQRFDYECSSPEVYRVFQMQVFPLPASGGFLLINSLHVSTRHRRKGSDASDLQYVRDGGLTMCCHCRRTRRLDSGVWDWVPAYLNQKAHHVAADLCQICFCFFYPTLADRFRHEQK